MRAMRETFGDCEFIPADPTNRGLISVGLTDRDDIDYYAVNADMDWEAVLANPFLVEHVVPHLPLTPTGDLDLKHGDVRPAEQIKEEVGAWYQAGPEARFWAYYGAADLTRIHGLWHNNWSEMPQAVPRRMRDLKDLLDDWGVEAPVQHSGEHHAWHDAVHNRRMYEAVRRMLDNKASKRQAIDLAAVRVLQEEGFVCPSCKTLSPPDCSACLMLLHNCVDAMRTAGWASRAETFRDVEQRLNALARKMTRDQDHHAQGIAFASGVVYAMMQQTDPTPPYSLPGEKTLNHHA